MTTNQQIILAIVLGGGAIWLLTQRWLWVLLGSVGALASFFAMAASVIHFQILGAVGFFFLMCMCGVISTSAADA